MTGYYLSVGYISGYAFQGNKSEAWLEMKLSAIEICHDPERIASEAVEVEPSCITKSYEALLEYAARYKDRQDLTIQFIEGEELKKRHVICPSDGEPEPYISQLASGGEPGRQLKEALRRAFARLLIREMHGKGIEVNFTVS